MNYVWLAIQIIAAIPDLIRAYREIRRIVDEDQKQSAKVAVKEITKEFKETKDAGKLKENLASLCRELKGSFHV